MEWYREAYRRMALIRAFETKAAECFTRSELAGNIHLYMGQEASGVGTCLALRETDYITSTHRGHGHCLAKGASPDQAMAELFGKETGYCRGRGGSMHIVDVKLGILGANGIVGAGIPLAARWPPRSGATARSRWPFSATARPIRGRSTRR